MAGRLDRRTAATEGSGSPMVRLFDRPLGRRLHVRRQLEWHRRTDVAGQRRQPAQRRLEGRGTVSPCQPEPPRAHGHARRSEGVYEAVDRTEQAAAATDAAEYGSDGDDSL